MFERIVEWFEQTVGAAIGELPPGALRYILYRV